ncbi:MAG TPA: hypothetical protein VKF60_19170 [Myxococcota bacterium]|nr:hypothetical protein [Myxococcota bacterium]
MANLRTSRLLRLAVLSLGVAWLAGLASAAAAPVVVPNDIASCVWLRVKAKGSGYELPAGDTGLGPKRSLSADCYLQLVYVDPDAGHLNGRYGGPLLCPIDAQNWAASPMEESFAGTKLGDLNVIAVDDYLTFTNAAGDVIQGWGTHRILISVDKTGAFRKASFQTLGGEMIDGSYSSLTLATVFGSYSASGSSVPAEKVPQPAKDLVAASPCNLP